MELQGGVREKDFFVKDVGGDSLLSAYQPVACMICPRRKKGVTISPGCTTSCHPNIGTKRGC